MILKTKKCKEYNKQWQKNNREKCCKYSKKYRENNPEKVKEYAKRHYKECKASAKKYYEENREKISKIQKEYYQRNLEKISKYSKEYRKRNGEKLRGYNREYYRNNIEKEKERKKEYRKNNPIYAKECAKEWRLNNFEKCRGYMKKRYLIPEYRVNKNISRLIRYSLRGNKNGNHWEIIVGYTLQDFINHIEKKFTGGMTWQNMGKNGWEIDHIIPVSLWKFASCDDREFKQCWALCNLQPLWAFDNLSKGNKIIKTAYKRK